MQVAVDLSYLFCFPKYSCTKTLNNKETEEWIKERVIIIILYGLRRLTCSGIDALPSFPGASTTSLSSRFAIEVVFRESVVMHSFKVVDPILFAFGPYILYSRDL